jgi:type-F conjugative transfer system pilin assembly protein TrbC
MLRILKLIIKTMLIFATAVYGSIPKYQEPSTAAKNEQKKLAREAIRTADLMIENGVVIETNLPTGKIQLPKQYFDFPDFIKQAKMGNYLADALTASESIQKESDGKYENPFIFISLGMPDGELRQIIADSKRVDAKIYIRGMYKDLKSTIARIQDLIGSDGGILIDPTVFKKFNITSVPTYIVPLTKNNEFIKAVGSVSFSYLLNLVMRTGSESEQKCARYWLGKY